VGVLKTGTENVHPEKTKAVPTSKREAPPSAAPHAPAGQKIRVDERHRTQRVLLRTRAQIHIAVGGKLATLDVTTLSVTPAGAVVVASKNLPPETRLVLEHPVTKQKIACKVVRAAREMPEGFHVPIEFDSPAADFWGIAFPPRDWNAADE
jgi:hypothetical protein